MNFAKLFLLSLILSACLDQSGTNVSTIDVKTSRVILREGDQVPVSEICASPKWDSSDSSIAMVDSGVLTGAGKGYATVNTGCGSKIDVIVGVRSSIRPDVETYKLPAKDQDRIQLCREDAEKTCETIGYGGNDTCHLNFAQKCSREDDRASFTMCVESFGMQTDWDCVLYWR